MRAIVCPPLVCSILQGLQWSAAYSYSNQYSDYSDPWIQSNSAATSTGWIQVGSKIVGSKYRSEHSRPNVNVKALVNDNQMRSVAPVEFKRLDRAVGGAVKRRRTGLSHATALGSASAVCHVSVSIHSMRHGRCRGISTSNCTSTSLLNGSGRFATSTFWRR